METVRNQLDGAKAAWDIPALLLTITLALLGNISLLQAGEGVAVILSIGMVWFHLANARLRKELGHPEIDGISLNLRGEQLLGIWLPSAVISTGFAACLVTEAMLPVLAVTTLVLGFVHTMYIDLQRRIHKKVARSNKEGCTEHVARKRRERDQRDPDSASEVDPPGMRRLYEYLAEEGWNGFSRMRTVILNLILIAVLLGIVGTAEGLIKTAWPAATAVVERVNGAETPETEEGKTSESKDPKPTQDGEETSGGEASERRCAHQPGEAAPRWAKETLHSLFLGHPSLEGATPPPGLDEGGCPERAVSPPGLADSFVYQVGRGPSGEALSIAVDSRRFGAQIFLAPAAQKVIDLIEAGQVPLGGRARADVRRGDMVAITTTAGTIVLLRDEKHLPGQPRMATPYVELPVPVAAAWAASIGLTGDWLWPLPQEAQGSRSIFGLAPSSLSPEIASTIEYDSAAGVAYANGYTYGVPAEQLSWAVLRAYARHAR